MCVDRRPLTGYTSKDTWVSPCRWELGERLKKNGEGFRAMTYVPITALDGMRNSQRGEAAAVKARLGC